MEVDSYSYNDSQHYSEITKFFAFDCQKYYLIKENNVFKFIIEKRNNFININCRNYNTQFNFINLSMITKIKYKDINDAYDYIINKFEKNQVIIKDIIINKVIILLFESNHGLEEIKINLLYNTNNKNKVINELNNKLIKEINYLKDEIKILKDEINDLKITNQKYCNYINNSLKINTNPKKISFLKDLTKDSFSEVDLDNTFSVIKSIDNILLLIYVNKNMSIISYDLINNQIINEIKNAHKNYITNFRHYLDNINKRDLILSISYEDNNIKLWNIKNWNCLLNINNINNKGYLYSACFLNYNNQLYILSSNYNEDDNCEPIKVYDCNGNKIREIDNSSEETYFIDAYYDNKTYKNYIMTGNVGCIKSYDYNKNELYHKYFDNDNNYGHLSIVINCNENNENLLESSIDGNIRIWDFHSGILLSKIKDNSSGIYGICLWNNNYLFIGCEDKTIKLINIENGNIINSLEEHNNYVLSLKKINHPIYGECLISQDFDDTIKLWIIKN